MLRCFLVSVAFAALWVFPSGAGELRSFGKTSFHEIQSALKRPLIVSFWSIHCAPCIVEMAEWRKVRKSMPQVKLVLVSTDPPRLARRVSNVLERHGMSGVETWIFEDEFAAPIRRSVDKSWRGTLPRTEVFLENGERRTVKGLLGERQLLEWLEESKTLSSEVRENDR